MSSMENPLKLTQEEAALQLVQDDQLSSYQTIFESYKQAEPNIAAMLGPHFNAFMETAKEVIKEDPKGELTHFLTIKQKIPNNLWVLFMEEYTKNSEPLSKDEKERVSEQFIKDIKKRQKGKDLN